MEVKTYFKLFISLLIIFVCVGIFIKRFRYYVASYFFSHIYSNPELAKFIGVKFDNVFTYPMGRKNSRIYSDGVFVKILKLITGMDLRVTDDVRFEMLRLQREHSKQIDMEPYFKEIYNKQMTLLEFEYFLSKILLVETNRLYEVFEQKDMEILIKNSIVVFEVLNGLSGGMIEGFKLMIQNVKALYEISKVLKKAPEAKRLMIFGPQLSLVTNFSKMLMRHKANKKSESDSKLADKDLLEAHNFLDLQTKFFVFEENHNQYNHCLIFLNRDKKDDSNGVDNKAFGPKGVTCPGNKLTIDYIESCLALFKKINIDIVGDAIFEGVRFKNISNKKDIKIVITQNLINY